MPRRLSVGEMQAPVLVIAPHPDDESLHCGALILALRTLRRRVHVLIVTDGRESHPKSAAYPARRLAAIREAEAKRALEVLQIPPSMQWFWRLRDGTLGCQGLEGSRAHVARATKLARHCQVRTMVVPWRRDPHPDHRAASTWFRRAARALSPRPRVLEYPGWAGLLPACGSLPRPGTMRRMVLDARAVRDAKCNAIECHASQLGRVVTDDPRGFVVPAALFQRATGPTEEYWEGNR